MAQTDDLTVLSRLSVHGVTKLNRDLIRGVPLPQILNDLNVVYDLCCARRKTLKKALTDTAKEMLAKLGRPYTQQELVLFGTAPIAWVEAAIKALTNAGYAYELAVEELAFHFQYQQLEADAREVRKHYEGTPVQVSQLVSTLCPASLNAASRNIVRVTPKKITVSLSPVMLWFNLDDVDDDEDAVSSDDETASNPIKKTSKKCPLITLAQLERQTSLKEKESVTRSTLRAVKILVP